MTHRLIDQFCTAINKWSDITQQDAGILTFLAMIHLGAPWFVRPEGAVENPRSPEHRNKKVGEVMGRYTVAQLHDYLAYLADDLKIFEDFLVVGLAHSIESELNGLVIDYEEGIDRVKEEAAWLQDVYDHPEKHADFLGLYQASLSRILSENEDANQSILHLANLFWKMSHPKPDDLAQRQSMLAAWKSVISSVTTRENLKQWRSKYLDGLIQ